MTPGNINERQIDLRSDASSNYASLKDYFDSVQINPTDAKYEATLAAGFSVLSIVDIADIAGGILPLDTAAPVTSITTALNAGLKGGIVSAKSALAIAAEPLVSSALTSTNSLGHILNRVEVREKASKNPLLVPSGADQGALLYGLIHTFSDTADGGAIGVAASETLSISLVYTNASGVITPFSYAGIVEFNLNLAYQLRHKPAVSLAGAGAIPQDEIGGTELEEAEFTVTADFIAGEVLTLATGAGDDTTPGASTVVAQPAGEDVVLPTDFDTNVNCVAELNGLRLKKGVQVAYASTTTLTVNLILDIGDVLTLRVPRN